MSINWDTPVSELMHGDDTIGLFESDEELMHFKYIKREKKNGKWVYYYHDAEYEKAKKNYDNARISSSNETLKRDLTIRKNDEKIRSIIYDEARKNPKASLNEVYAKIKPYDAGNVWAKAKADVAAKRVSETKSAYEKAKKAYDKSAGRKVADLLNKTSDGANKVVTKAKNLVNNVLNPKTKSKSKNTTGTHKTLYDIGKENQKKKGSTGIPVYKNTGVANQIDALLKEQKKAKKAKKQKKPLIGHRTTITDYSSGRLPEVIYDSNPNTRSKKKK